MAARVAWSVMPSLAMPSESSVIQIRGERWLEGRLMEPERVGSYGVRRALPMLHLTALGGPSAACPSAKEGCGCGRLVGRGGEGGRRGANYGQT